MNRVVSVYLPNWPIDRLRRAAGDTAPPADHPLVLAGRQQNRRTVMAACPASQHLSRHGAGQGPDAGAHTRHP